MAQTRATDPPADSQPFMKVTREVSLPWLIGGVVSILVQAVVLWSGQVEQGKRLTEVASELRSVSKTLNDNAVKDATTDYQLTDLNRRLTALEARAGAVRP